MFDLLSVEEDRVAANHGWQLCLVYDLATSRWLNQVLPYDVRFTGAAHASAAVIEQAKSGSALALKALRLVMQGHQPRKKK